MSCIKMSFLEQAGVERLVLHAGGKKYETGFFLQKSKMSCFSLIHTMKKT